MGYFSNLELERDGYGENNIYPSPDKQLLWRLEDLESRLEELKEGSAPYRGKDEGLRLTESDIRYILPERFKNLADIERAIDIAIGDLRSKYDVDALYDAQILHRLIGIPCLCRFKLVEQYNALSEAA